jgi:hypothetical protein
MMLFIADEMRAAPAGRPERIGTAIGILVAVVHAGTIWMMARASGLL